tara:strand:+ start:787 stop:1017 length:231 start_codon:yes stop_codon:yes gene_type:complete
MPDEDKAITLLQSINKEIALTLDSIKQSSKDSNTMDSAATVKLEELLNQIKQVKAHITAFMNRYNKQTKLTDYTNL